VRAAWLGHTEAVADEFYRTVTDEHFARAIAGPAEAAQNAAQQARANDRNVSHAEKPSVVEVGEMQRVASHDEECLESLVGVTGLEPVTSSV
jgi:hypothetical protein